MRCVFTFSALIVYIFSISVASGDDAAALLKTIQSPDKLDVDRANAFEKIGDIAGDEVIDALAGYLGDERWSHYARFALQKMPGPAATEALVKAIDAVEGNLRVGVVVTIGRRQDPNAVPPLVELLDETDARLAAAAAVALGWIGTDDAVTSLSDALAAETDADCKESLASALLVAGQQLAKKGNRQAASGVFDFLRQSDLSKPCRIGATQNAILVRGAEGVDLMMEQLRGSDLDYFRIGLAAARVVPGETATKRLAGLLESEPSPQRTALLIQAIQDRGDRLALPAVTTKLQSDALEVQLAAIRAVGGLGNGTSVPILLSAANEATAAVVLDSLVSLKGADVNTALMQAAQPPNGSPLAVQALGERRADEAVDLFFQLTKDGGPEIGEQAIAALGMTAPQDRFLDLLALLEVAEDDARTKTVQNAIHGAVFRSTQPDACADALCAMIPAASGPDREFLFEQVRTAGGARAVACMREFATGPDESLRDAATKTLGRWHSADAAPVLLEVARGNGEFANRAMSGYIRIFRQFELPEAERVAMAGKALDVASRSHERNAAIEAMTRFPCVGTYELALAQLDAPGSEDKAAQAVLTIARTVLDLDPEKATAGLGTLIEADISKSATDAAKALLSKHSLR